MPTRLLIALLTSQPAVAYDPAPWRADLVQMRRAIDRDYANLDWLTGERGFNLDQEFAATATRIDAATGDDQARAAFDRLVRRMGDGHIDLSWPSSPRAAVAKVVPSPEPCAAYGFNATMVMRGVADSLPGYHALPGNEPFSAGTVTVGGTRVGVLRIGLFEPAGYPDLCRAALAKTPHATADEVTEIAYTRMTAAMETRLAQLKAVGAQVLLVDLAGNGGGSEWTEAAARMVTGRKLHGARMAVIPNEPWRASRIALAKQLREAARTTPPYRDRLLQQAKAIELGARPCSTDCPRLADNGFPTGVFDDPPARANLPYPIDSIAQFKARRGLWTGPLMVLVDDESWSAAEEFAATLQDNRAAVIVGTRSGGAGCGHTTGREAATLDHSGATLSLPDCVRFRRDGSNEVRGIVPDVPVAMRQNDSVAFKAGLLSAALPAAIAASKLRSTAP